MTDAALPLQSAADQKAIAAIRRKNAVWRRILRDPAAALAALFLLAIVAVAVLAPWIAPHDPYASNMRLRFCPPMGERCPTFLLGADNQGRDMLSRIMFGLQATLGMGVIAVAAVIGTASVSTAVGSVDSTDLLPAACAGGEAPGLAGRVPNSIGRLLGCASPASSQARTSLGSPAIGKVLPVSAGACRGAAAVMAMPGNPSIAPVAPASATVNAAVGTGTGPVPGVASGVRLVESES